MSYEYKSIRDVMEMISGNEIYLPAIQRKFVWKNPQIESLFDSIMRGYPIGTFLFWFVKGEKINEYTFYKFLQEYHEKDNFLNEIAPKPELRDAIIGVLDGQQRLSSMYIALQGTYAYKKPYYHWNNELAFPIRQFYLNLFKIPIDEAKRKKEQEVNDDELSYVFKFLTKEESQIIDEEHLWFPAREVLTWDDDPLIDEYYDNLVENEDLQEDIKTIISKKRRAIKKTLRKLHQRLVLENLISYYIIQEQELDNILDIFVRVNSGGTVLSKSDLLFSTIVANWEEGRKEFEEFLERNNKKGNGFFFNTDFLMRSCLVLTDCPVLFKVRSFKKENIKRIKKEWDSVKEAISKTIDLLVEFGFNGETLTSQMAIIPVAYYFKKGGDDAGKSKLGIRKYIIHSLLKQIFGGQGDTVLANIRDAMRHKSGETFKLKIEEYNLEHFKETYIPGGRTFDISEDDINEMLEYKKGPYTFMILSLLYSHLKFNLISFHQDHIHPASLFTPAKLQKYSISEAERYKWSNMKDMLPNLQIMEGRENEKKNKTPFKEWLYDQRFIEQSHVEIFKTTNYIPETADLDFREFDEFFEARKEILRKEITKVLL